MVLDNDSNDTKVSRSDVNSALKAFGMAPGAFAKRAGVAYNTLIGFLDDTRMPQEGTRKKLRKALDNLWKLNQKKAKPPLHEKANRATALRDRINVTCDDMEVSFETFATYCKGLLTEAVVDFCNGKRELSDHTLQIVEAGLRKLIKADAKKAEEKKASYTRAGIPSPDPFQAPRPATTPWRPSSKPSFGR